MSIKMLVTDLDGTLLRTDFSISERTKKSLADCRAKGIKVVYATGREATKSKALHEIANFWKIAQTEIVAFGDDINDIDLLAYAGMGVAMGNALNVVKADANYVCGTSDDDGVVKWIEENVL
ncbi:MAG: HAD hydrolase family protein [Oscillospiraceae bacterium]|nr:HAD hydrolase family protein [Oscillospiraceae bacterium]